MQLTLFTEPQALTAKARRNKAGRKRPGRAGTPHWDLWTQETEEEKEMALFFLDIRNFTPLVEAHLALDVIYIIRKLFATFQNIIRVNHGQIIETAGDGFYAAFGFDSSVEEAVNAAVNAGQSIIRTLETLNEQTFTKKLNRKIDVGIGLHAGRVATGNIALGAKDHLVVMGYPVNIAARLQEATKQLNNNFVISSAVYHLLRNPPLNKTTASLELKGVNGTSELHLIGNPYH